jgi:NAD(P)-dependent dehydrogenase (short-subunit alcohol dehydrogenase family)
MDRFVDKVVLVTGAGSGIGRAAVQRLLAEGAKVACVDVNKDALNATAALAADRTIALVCDVSQPDQVSATVSAAVAHFGGLNVLCNVAGILKAAHSHDADLDDWNRIIAVNLTGTFLMCRAALPHLLRKKGNNIVNTSSTAALGSHPWMAAYAASKGGVLALTRSLAAEYVREGLRVNTLIPGGIATPIHGSFAFPDGANRELIRGAMPQVRMVGPEYAASAIAFLASDDARYMNGAELRIDGGAMS